MSRILPLLLAALLLAGCGGDDGGSASEDYANDVCSSLSTWLTDIETTTESLKDSGLATIEDDARAAAEDMRTATDTLAGDLSELGPPDSEDGREAKAELDALATQLSTQADSIEAALESGKRPAEAAASVLASLSTAASAVQSSYDTLRELDPAGELQEAFENADECESFREQVDELGSGG